MLDVSVKYTSLTRNPNYGDGTENDKSGNPKFPEFLRLEHGFYPLSNATRNKMLEDGLEYKKAVVIVKQIVQTIIAHDRSTEYRERVQ